MGANVSGIVADSNGDELSSLRPRLSDMPESCVALFIVDKVLGRSSKTNMVDYLSKKHLYARLCSPSPFDGGNKMFTVYRGIQNDFGYVQEMWLDKNTGGLCVSISSKALAITGIDDRRYWTHISTEESRFQSVAYLQQIWWFEVDGEFEFQFPVGTYSLFFRLQLGKPSKRLGRRVCKFEHVHGWDIKPVRFLLTTSDGQHAVSQCFLENPGHWVHYRVADFVVEDPSESTKIKFSLTQIDCTHTKGEYANCFTFRLSVYISGNPSYPMLK
ncbi:F-box protein PP2-A13 [Citrus sinensis]|nr:F-box protein PP2-A13 [Citrus sinensis]